jgi:protein involved in sex pheromone biosynthesis
LAPFPSLTGLPPSQEDKEHASNGNGDPKDPEEKTPPYLRHILEPNKWNDKIQKEEK